MITHKPYQEKLDRLKAQMIESQKLAEKFPCFKDEILRHNAIETDSYYKLGDRYKNMYLSWGVNVGYYKTDKSGRYMTNFKGTYDSGMFVDIYINTLSLYDSHSNYGLEELAKGVFYYDSMNTTFYIEADKLCKFMPKLLAWYDNAIKENCKASKEAERKELRDRLEALENTECK